MCNLYSVTKGEQAIREAYRAMVDRTGNLPTARSKGVHARVMSVGDNGL